MIGWQSTSQKPLMNLSCLCLKILSRGSFLSMTNILSNRHTKMFKFLLWFSLVGKQRVVSYLRSCSSTDFLECLHTSRMKFEKQPIPRRKRESLQENLDYVSWISLCKSVVRVPPTVCGYTFLGRIMELSFLTGQVYTVPNIWTD